MFAWLAKHGNLDALTILHTFNAGIGFVLCVSAEEADAVQARLSSILDGEQVYRLGTLNEKGSDEEAIAFLNTNTDDTCHYWRA